MNLTTEELKLGGYLLNLHAVNIRGKELSYYVHYWGGERNHYSNNVHMHSFYEVCYIIDGKGFYWEKGRMYPLEKGVLFVSRPNIKHRITSESGLYIFFIGFELVHSECSEDFLQQFERIAKSKRFFLQNMEQCPTTLIWQAIMAAAVQMPSYAEHHMMNLCYSLLSSFESVFRNELNERQPLHYTSSSTTIVHRAKLYIRDNLSERMQLKDVADYLHLSTRHLSRLFKTELGQSFNNYVRKEKIRQAATLLMETDLSIQAVAEMTGFDTVHYFTTVFKKEIGVTPGKFLKHLQENKEVFLPL